MLRNIMISAFASAALVILAGCNMAGTRTAGADYQTNLDRTISSGTLRTLTLRTGAGTIKIVGEESRRSIEIEGIVSTHAESYQEAKRIAGEVTLNIQADKTENPVVAISEPLIASGDQYYTCDLTIRVPHTVQVTLNDSAGDVEIYGLASGLKLTGDSGKVTVEGMNGGLVIHTAGSKTSIRDAIGHLQITDGDGDLEIAMISGDVAIQDAGGKLLVQNITGNVTASDNPAGVTLKNIDGDVTLIRISPASSRIQGVTGNLSYPSGTE